MSASPSHQEDSVRTIRTMSLGTLWRMLRYPFILLSLAIVPRLMGDVDYGRYAYFISLFVILNACTDLGFLQIFGRFIPESEATGDRHQTLRLLYGLLAFGLLLAVLLALGVWVTYLFYPWGDLSLHWISILCVLLILTRIEGTFFNFIYGMNQIARFSAKEMLRSAMTLGLVVLFYHWYGLTGAFWALAANELLLALIGGYWIRAFLAPQKVNLSCAALRPYVVFGVGFFVPALLLGLLQRAGNIFVHAWSGAPEHVAYYDIANQYLLLTTTFIGLILQTLLPSLAKWQVTNRQETMERWQRVVMAYCAVLGFLSVNALMWLGEPLVRIWLGNTFAPVVQNAKVISLAIVPALIAYAGMNYALLEKKARTYVASVGTAMVVMTLSALVLVPRYDALGASLATVLGYWGMGMVFLFSYRAHFRKTLNLFWVAVGVAALFSLGYLWPLPDGAAAVAFVLTSLAYLLVLMPFKVVSVREGLRILNALRRR